MENTDEWRLKKITCDSQPQTIATTKVADYRRYIVVSLSSLFQLDAVEHNASDAVVPDSKNESDKTTVDSLSAPTTCS